MNERDPFLKKIAITSDHVRYRTQLTLKHNKHNTRLKDYESCGQNYVLVKLEVLRR